MNWVGQHGIIAQVAALDEGVLQIVPFAKYDAAFPRMPRSISKGYVFRGQGQLLNAKQRAPKKFHHLALSRPKPHAPAPRRSGFRGNSAN
jgi:hypothetical protein